MPTPKGGGIGILGAFCVSGLALGVPWALVAAGAGLSLFSLCVDKADVSPKLRLFIHGLVTLLFLWGVCCGARVCGCGAAGLLLGAAALVFVAGTFNIYNFMDGINGIAGVTAVAGFGMLAFYSHTYALDMKLAGLCAAMAAASAGFLPFNMPKARVFMGDVGSILLGFVFAAVVVMLTRSALDFVCLAGFMFPFYADEVTTMYARIQDGENLLKAHRRHYYQLLANEMGVAHWKISCGYGLAQVAIGAGVLALRPWGVGAVAVFLAVCFVASCFMSWRLRRAVAEAGR